MIGQTIAHYRVTAKLGQGGMGAVYRATDTKLDREVAIKVLPDSLIHDPQRLVRFEREAKALAALNHPSIAGIYGLEKSGDSQALVLELVEGEDLSERLKRGPLPVEEALEVCKQIAEALEAAHEKGIIHRDLKPGNIKLLPDGRVKVLDFGLAKVVSDTPSASQGSTELEDSPTVFTQGQATMPGVLLGTAGYMSPEQARGKPVDKRSDIWSFGVVLFECLTGGRLFPGETVTDSVGALLHKEIEWNQLPPSTPPTIQLLLRKCLARDRKRRLRDIGDAVVDLEQAIADPASSTLRLSDAAPREGGTTRHYSLSIVAALVSLAMVITALAVWFLKPGPTPRDAESAATSGPSPVRKLAPSLEGIWHQHRNTRTLLSPDGKRIVYQNREDAQWRELQVRELAQLNSRGLPGTRAEYFWKPFWSPNSQELAYFLEADNALGRGQLLRAPIDGGEPTTIAKLPAEFRMSPWDKGGGAWLSGLSGGRIVFTDGRGHLWEVPAQGGDAEVILDAGETGEKFQCPSPLPDGRGVLLLVQSKAGRADKIAVYVHADRSPKTVFELQGESFAFAVYDSGGYLVYDRATTTPGIWAVPFSLERLETTGEPFKVADGTDPSVGDDGSLLYLEGTSVHDLPICRLVWLDQEGNAEPIPVMKEQTMAGNVCLSPDESLALVEVRDPETDQVSIWLHDLNRPGTPEPVTRPPAGMMDFQPQWHPVDGQRFFFRRLPIGADEWRAVAPIMMARIDGAMEARELARGVSYSLSGDGKYLVYQTPKANEPGGWDIAYLVLDEGDPSPRILPGTSSSRTYPQISPDGKFLAYVSEDLDPPQVYLTRFPVGEGRPWPVTKDGASFSFWGKDASHPVLYYYNKRGHLLSRIDVTFPDGGGAPEFADSKPVYEVNALGLRHRPGVGLTRDGKRFLAAQRSVLNPEEGRRVILVENWLAEFKEGIPATRP